MLLWGSCTSRSFAFRWESRCEDSTPSGSTPAACAFVRPGCGRFQRSTCVFAVNLVNSMSLLGTRSALTLVASCFGVVVAMEHANAATSAIFGAFQFRPDWLGPRILGTLGEFSRKRTLLSECCSSDWCAVRMVRAILWPSLAIGMCLLRWTPRAVQSSPLLGGTLQRVRQKLNVHGAAATVQATLGAALAMFEDIV